MSLDPRYITSLELEEYFIDKDTGLPLAGGIVTFYHQNSPSNKKNVFMLSNNGNNFNYIALPNPVILSSIGTVQDNNGNNVKIYYFPYDADGNQDLYFITVQSSTYVPQFTRSAIPNPGGTINPPGNDFLFNYIPNGQLLAHTNLPNNALFAGSNIIAQGGFSIELPTPAHSTNTLQFIEQGADTPFDGLPRYALQLTCSVPSTMDSFKNIRVKFNDVNKFSGDEQFVTFGFEAFANTGLNVDIDVFKFFGTDGSVVAPFNVGVTQITTTCTYFSFSFQLGSNEGQVIDPVAQNDFVAIDIVCPNNLGFILTATNFVLANGEVTLTGFIEQTNADMISRGVAGWLDVPNPTGYDLFLPPILTQYGMTYDASQIGDVGMSIGPIASPLSTSPIPLNNKMPCDGMAYITSQYAANGIPFSRLQNTLVATNPTSNGLPIYGTGQNYVSAYPLVSASAHNIFKIIYNAAGAGSTTPTFGNAGATLTIANIIKYNGSTTGIANFGYVAFNNVANSVLAVLNNTAFKATPFNKGDGTNFSLTIVNDFFTGITAQFSQSLLITTLLPASSFPSSGNSAYFQFASNTVQYVVWFQNGTSVLPTGLSGTNTPIEVDILGTETAQEITDLVRAVMNGYAAAYVTINSSSPIPPQSSYFTYYSNPASLRSFYAWFNINNGGSDPSVGGTSIEVQLPVTPTATQVRDNIISAINTYQFAAPDFRGMFFRGADLTGIWDDDVAQRWSSVGGISGGMPGTFEFGQLQSHVHPPATGTAYVYATSGASPPGGGNIFAITSSANTGTTGGSETRPINTYIFPFIRY